MEQENDQDEEDMKMFNEDFREIRSKLKKDLTLRYNYLHDKELLKHL